jgi:hypothetical protein
MMRINILVVFIHILFFQIANAQPQFTFAVIGDYGADTQAEEDVSVLVKSWNPEFILTVGDNNYENGSASTIDRNIGQYYHEFIFPYLGTYGSGSPDSNRFFPVPGNHDWVASNLTPYRDYFTLPNNERYYDFVWENVHFFMIDADPHEPDGYSENSVQALWMKSRMEASTADWQIAVLHFSPYCSGGDHGSISTVQWPYKQWGADAVFSGHDHIYERLLSDGLDYWVNGLGGKNIDSLDDPISESQILFNGDFGAMRCEVYNDSLTIKFITRTGVLIDQYSVAAFPTHTINETTNGFSDFSLNQNYPNPFNPSTRMTFSIPTSGFVSLKVFDVLGNEAAIIVDQDLTAGSYDFEFNASGLTSGVYYYTLKAGSFLQTKQMILLK